MAAFRFGTRLVLGSRACGRRCAKFRVRIDERRVAHHVTRSPLSYLLYK